MNASRREPLLVAEHRLREPCSSAVCTVQLKLIDGSAQKMAASATNEKWVCYRFTFAFFFLATFFRVADAGDLGLFSRRSIADMRSKKFFKQETQ